MTDAPVEPDLAPAPEQVPVAPAEPESAGTLLMRCREAAGLSRADVAHKLKFSQRQIEALEGGDYAALGGTTFVRGFVRTYAKLLGADAGAAVAALERSALPPAAVPVTADPKGIPFPSAAPPVSPVLRYAVISLGVIATAILVLYLWHGEEFLSGPVASAPPAKKAAPPPPATAEVTQPVALAPSVVPVGAAVEEKAAAAPRAPERAADAPQEKLRETPPRSTASGRRLELSFERDAWAEVRDVNGNVLFSQLNLAGTQRVIEGRAPFELVIGNARFVSLRYRDAPFDLKPYTRADVARVTLN